MWSESLNPYLYSTFHALFAIAVCAVAWFHPDLGERWFAPVEATLSRFAAHKTLAIASVFLVAIVVRLLLLPWFHVPVPGHPDEFSYLLMGDTFAHGRLAYPPHPMWLSFETLGEFFFPTYCSVFNPAHGAVLALGQLLGHPWIGVLLSVAALCAALVWAFQAWMPARWALLGGVFGVLNIAVVSYWINSYWGGAVAGIGGALVLGAVPRIMHKQSVHDALLMGAGAAILANSRPLEGLIFCLPFAIALLLWMRRRSPARVIFLRVVAPAGGVLVLTFVFIGYYNHRLTGNAWLMPHMMTWRDNLTSPLLIWEHQRPLKQYDNRQIAELYNVVLPRYYNRTWAALWKVSTDKVLLYWEVFLWAGAFPILACVPALLRDRKGRWLLGEALVCLLGLFAVVFSFPHYAAPVFCVFYAVLVQALRHLRLVRFRGRRVGLGLSRAVVVLLVFQIVTAIPERLHHPDAWSPVTSVRGDEERALVVQELNKMLGKHLVLVRYGENHDIGHEWVFNDADIDGSKIVWAREMSPEQNAKLLAYYPDRQVWLVEPEQNPDRLISYLSARPSK